ncbi:hypothetical protein F3F90_13130 [Bacteroides salyersiae]|uniref:Uncharacterized protein n=1 Tax=Bacteroides salyersiae TaxID=291644 RepID=A0A7J4XMQ4_9BACE|nr:hypothetical protein F3F90_13130 [Bacteroides salyersiae]KAA3696127.1 hypothetical protein F3F88_15885 [Bacteroides salyersiae]KAA3697448.1 hypothetical protein F3F89_09500 [Bacteroides salyersiae]KAA3702532.1 hypothetical protein F3G09_22775 [Bacteroides salyersiae]KAA3708029.1 hypothetical protein F3F83_02650 [Bacteroides salyersiae]
MYSDRNNSFQDIREKKKRYAHLVLENVGNFQIRCKDSIVVLTLIAWAAIVTSASMVSYDLQVKSVARSSRFFNKCII